MAAASDPTSASAQPTALITGASRGLGAATARELAGTHRLLLGARSVESLHDIAAELPGAQPWPVDLTDYEALPAAIAPIDRLDVLVHNAGVAELGTIAESSVAQWRNTLEANVIAVSELTRLLLPALRAAHGHVVLINSGAGLRANPGWGVYAAAKFALRAFGDALRAEEPRLRVTSIHPGRIDTDMQREIVAGEGREYDPGEFLTAATVARAVRNAVETPRDAHPTEIVLRPTARLGACVPAHGERRARMWGVRPCTAGSAWPGPLRVAQSRSVRAVPGWAARMFRSVGHLVRRSGRVIRPRGSSEPGAGRACASPEVFACLVGSTCVSPGVYACRGERCAFPQHAYVSVRRVARPRR